MSLFLQFELSLLFQALLLSTYVDSMYLVRVTPPINFTVSDDSLFLYLGGGHKFSEFACFYNFRYKKMSVIQLIGKKFALKVPNCIGGL